MKAFPHHWIEILYFTKLQTHCSTTIYSKVSPLHPPSPPEQISLTCYFTAFQTVHFITCKSTSDWPRFTPRAGAHGACPELVHLFTRPLSLLIPKVYRSKSRRKVQKFVHRNGMNEFIMVWGTQLVSALNCITKCSADHPHTIASF